MDERRDEHDTVAGIAIQTGTDWNAKKTEIQELLFGQGRIGMQRETEIQG